jgi:DNA-repair protein XRCC3
LELWEDPLRRRRLSLGCAVLDGCTGGGLPLQGVTEVSGEAGAGKTQLAMSLVLQCCLPVTHGGLGGKAVYMCCGEGEFPIRRLGQLATSASDRAGTSSHDELMKMVVIMQFHTADDVLDALKKTLPSMCASDGVRLVVIDSIAGMVRHEYGSRSVEDMTHRTVLFFKVAKELKWLADIYSVCIVVINQVAGKGFDNGNGAAATSFGSSSSSSSYSSSYGNFGNGNSNGNNIGGHRSTGGNESSPALGLAWSHCVNTRICLHRDTVDMRVLVAGHEGGGGGGGGGGGPEFPVTVGRGGGGRGGGGGDDDDDAGDPPDGNAVPVGAGVSRSRRTFMLECSPYTPRSCCAYTITANGVTGV